ncbi:hypothetical protein BC939DRAFT_434991 [Gamsiella multidivaricata]|uniref:uncharacterized protein n=1 Tax=Gamsiella multidivaricata TaxID=101098 RepID=UPI00221EB719|nr:uncharacterized protein BC939DRAFT_434991 [Gamsiella multidivaricata]KAI7832248.1 hypothetical protein BC939DRAFT_434991 [Gamsiella multidivaricata]
MLDEKCTRTILCQTEEDAKVPATWSDLGHYIHHNVEQVKLRSLAPMSTRLKAWLLIVFRTT